MGDVSSHVGISAEYLAQHLGVSGLKVESVTPIGTGQMAESYRVSFAAGSHGQLPPSVVVKVPSQSESSRAASRITRCYELETGFYTHVRSLVGVSAPNCLHVWFDAPSDDFVLVLEDIVSGKQGDQLSGASVEQARAAVDELVLLHAPLWNSPQLNTLSWMPRHTMESSQGTRDLLRSVFAGFTSRFESRVGAEVLELGAQLVANIDGYDRAFPNNETIVHRDFRLDNLLFTETSHGTQVKVVDWQTASISSGATDLAYFIGASFASEKRRALKYVLPFSFKTVGSACLSSSSVFSAARFSSSVLVFLGASAASAACLSSSLAFSLSWKMRVSSFMIAFGPKGRWMKPSAPAALARSSSIDSSCSEAMITGISLNLASNLRSLITW